MSRIVPPAATEPLNCSFLQDEEKIARGRQLRSPLKKTHADLPSTQQQNWRDGDLLWHTTTPHPTLNLTCMTGKTRKRLAKAIMSHPLIVNLSAFRVDTER